MQYVGGKAKLGAQLVRHIRPAGKVIWEPFCGGLNMTWHLCQAGASFVVCSDVHAPLIALCQALQAGWVPPDHVTREEYQAAKVLPDTDPLKAFIGIGCSFGGKWFGGYAVNARGYNYARCAKNSCLKIVGLPVRFFCADFFTVTPMRGLCLYLDPPYRGTQGYVSGSFDPDKFWDRCLDWKRAGSEVWISEYSAPAGFTVVTEQQHRRKLNLNDGVETIERLFTC